MSESTNLSNFSNKELQLLIGQLDQAIFNHDQWYKNLLRILVSHLSPDQSDLLPDAHKHCRFGQWYDSSQALFIQEHPAFISLGESHRQMHDSARVLLLKISDDLPIPVAEWDQFDNNLERMRLEFHALRHEFTDISHNRDPLTEAQNRASMLPAIREQQALVNRGKQSCVLAMLDLDHFKRVNDEYGHAAGDTVLVSLVHCLKGQLRQYDRIFRYGGEEFLICMPSTSLEQASRVGERMREAVEQLRIPISSSEEVVQITVSVGLAMLRKNQTVEESIECADKAMYKAKMSGRNRVELAD